MRVSLKSLFIAFLQLAKNDIAINTLHNFFVIDLYLIEIDIKLCKQIYLKFALSTNASIQAEKVKVTPIGFVEIKYRVKYTRRLAHVLGSVL